LKTTDIKPMMAFAHRDTEGVLFIVDEVAGEEASGREFKCGRALGNDVITLAELVNEERWQFIGMDPVGEALLKKKRWAMRPLMVFHEVSDLAGSPDIVIDELYADGNGPHTAVCRAVGIAHPTNETPFEVKVTDLLDEKKYTFQPELTVGTMHEKIRYLQDYVRSLKQSPGKLTPDELRAAILSCNACGAPLKQGEMMVCAVCDAALGTKVTPVEGKPNTFNYEFNTKPRPPPHEYVQTDPYKGCGTCGFGQGAYQHNSENIARYKAEQTVADLKARLEKAESQLKARRVVQVTPVAGSPGPNGDGTVYEFKMPEAAGIERLLVLRHEPGSLSHEQMRAISDGVRKKLPGVLVLFAQPNWELTLLELPK
jgi:hypothetical protein